MRKFVAAAFVVLVGITFVVGGEYTINGFKISDDGKTATGKKGKKGDTTDVKLAVSDKVKIFKGKFNKDTKKVEAGDAIEGGFKSETFTKAEKGVTAFVVTEGEGDKETIVEIRVTQKKKKAAN